jgi:hypothetical protein
VDDLDFDMKFDSDSAVLIRECQSAKLYYAEKDDFEKAAAFKEIEDQLKDIGMKISSLETKKATAIVNDDFKTAKRWNDQIDELRVISHDKLENAPDIFKYRQVFSSEKNNQSNNLSFSSKMADTDTNSETLSSEFDLASSNIDKEKEQNGINKPKK